jgi:acyl-CoA reductase-like NAD-dependent aldehyde dehydrogenase
MTETARGSVEASTQAGSEHDVPPERPHFDSLDPRTGEVVGQHRVHDAVEVAECVSASRDAQRWWVGLGFSGRKQRLDEW